MASCPATKVMGACTVTEKNVSRDRIMGLMGTGVQKNSRSAIPTISI